MTVRLSHTSRSILSSEWHFAGLVSWQSEKGDLAPRTGVDPGGMNGEICRTCRDSELGFAHYTASGNGR